MKKIFNYMKNNILKFCLIFLGVFFLINFMLYLINIRFRSWFIIIFVVLFFIGFVLGITQIVMRKKKVKKEYIPFIMIIVILICIIMILCIVFCFKKILRAEHVVELDDKIYVAVVDADDYVDVSFYDYSWPLFVGTKVKVHGYYGKGSYDPFVDIRNFYEVTYTYYDENGRENLEKHILFGKDENGKIVATHSYEKEFSVKEEFSDNDNYLMPEDEEVLYERKFDDVILRFTKVDSVLGQNDLVRVLRSRDGGKNFYGITNEAIKVSSEAKFVFLNNKLGFVISTGDYYLDSDIGYLYVTQDGGITFNKSKFNYTNERVSFISIVDFPYFEDDILKIKCSVYDFRSDGTGYETVYLIFASHDNGLTWDLVK